MKKESCWRRRREKSFVQFFVLPLPACLGVRLCKDLWPLDTKVIKGIGAC